MDKLAFQGGKWHDVVVMARCAADSIDTADGTYTKKGEQEGMVFYGWVDKSTEVVNVTEVGV